ncbi:hypothetical protein DFR48_104105 [Ciceribacter lividus]|uniref:Uncharacterized protein n=1 Tax=Ciceribacter lividus TaxID=1197950 RepID=A0A6I7HNR3_9HYPH|nr:hypothetical protein DFR48_104105 [Ciceribacter lividus]
MGGVGNIGELLGMGAGAFPIWLELAMYNTGYLFFGTATTAASADSLIIGAAL